MKIPQNVSDALLTMLTESFAPYKSFDKIPTAEELLAYRNKLHEAGFPIPENQEEDLYEQLTEDLEDDFKNCGGIVFHRLHDCSLLWPLFTEEQRTELTRLLHEYLIIELEQF